MALTGFAIPHVDRRDRRPKNDSPFKLDGDPSQWLSAKAYPGDPKGDEVGSFRPEGCSNAFGLEPRHSLFPHEEARNRASLGVITRCDGCPHKLTDRAES
jgi:hypothetical protein